MKKSALHITRNSQLYVSDKICVQVSSKEIPQNYYSFKTNIYDNIKPFDFRKY